MVGDLAMLLTICRTAAQDGDDGDY